MTDNEVKKWLNRAYKIEPIIKQDIEEIKKMNDLIDSGFGIDYEKPLVQSSVKNEAPFERRIERLADYTEKVNKRIKEQVKIKDEIRSTIEKLDDFFERSILILRHCYYLRWIDIEIELNYSKAQCFRIYNQAIKNIKKHIKDDTQ